MLVIVNACAVFLPNLSSTSQARRAGAMLVEKCDINSHIAAETLCTSGCFLHRLCSSKLPVSKKLLLFL